MMIPRINATASPLITSPPKIAIASMVTRVVSEVFIVRERVLLRASFTFFLKSAFG